jgi:hypothetical protein
MTKLTKLCGLVICLVLLYALSMGPVARFTLYPLNPRYEPLFNKLYSPIFRLRAISPAFSAPIDRYVGFWAPGYDIFFMPIGTEPYPADISTPSAATSSSPPPQLPASD